ncbi:MAG: hypothetical protein PF503_18775 [Desulfobacula sp.]|jgi:hypothetical protein|nr:hypothetical protein [Desulfobacula sp.]
MFPCVFLTELAEAREIGAVMHPKDNSPAVIRDDAHTLLVFTDIRSFEVVISALHGAKERFEKNGSAILDPQQITDEV